jgi:uncharacterized phiE125 gp8 family phage protein
MKTTLVTPPANLPITLAEAKDHLRIESTFTNDNAYIRSLIFVAMDQVESVLRRKLITQTWKAFYDCWPTKWELPYGQLQSVTHVKYTDSGGTVNTDFNEGDEFTVDTDSDPGRIVLKYGEVYPGNSLAEMNPIEVQMVVGYGTHASQVITAASNASPIVVTIVGHGYSTGDQVQIESVAGNTAANGLWFITKADADTFSLNGSAGNAAYTSGGSSTIITVPEPIRHAIRMLVSESYENREETVIGTMTAKLKTDPINNLLQTYRLWGF